MVGPLRGERTVVARSEDIAMMPPDDLRQQQQQISSVLGTRRLQANLGQGPRPNPL